MEKKPKNVFINHGEILAQQVLRNYIEERFNIPVTIPDYESSYTIDGKFIKTDAITYKSTRFDILELLSLLKQDVDELSNSVKTEIKTDVNTDSLNIIYKKLSEVKKAITEAKKINK